MDEKPPQKNAALSQDRKAILQRYITLGELTASISHEVKNLLLSINGYCELMEEKLKNNDPIKEELHEIKRTSELAKNIFMELLNFSSSHEESDRLDINALIKDVLLILKTEKKVTYKTQFDEKLPPILVSAQKIKQVLINLIMNGVHAIGDKKGTIEVTTGLLSNCFGVFASIRDSGCGMNEETAKNLFQPFFTTKSKGTGLGLSVCQDIMKEHNGYITVESHIEEGSLFTLVFLFEQFKTHPDIIDI